MAKMKMTPSSGNVFVDLGFDKAEAEVMQLRSDLIIDLMKHLRTKQWTQHDAARHLHISKARVTKLMKGSWHDFTLEMLMTLAYRAGMKLTLTVSSPRSNKAV